MRIDTTSIRNLSYNSGGFTNLVGTLETIYSVTWVTRLFYKLEVYLAVRSNAITSQS